MSNAKRSLALGFLCLAFRAGLAPAQVTETPVPFDSAGKVMTLTPALVSRFELSAPTWPAQGEFREARLYAVSTGGKVLAIEWPTGSVNRYPLTEDEAARLRSAIDAAMIRSGTMVTEARSDVISEPARGAFVRNQMGLTWGLYAPLLMSFTNDGQTATVLLLLSTGASYFIATDISRKTTITRSQNHLATDGAMRGAAAGAGLLFTFVGENGNQKAFSATALLGAVGGTILGYKRGRRLTDSEAQAATTMSNYAAITAFGLGGALGGLNETDDGREMIGSIVAAGLAGYALGPSYARQRTYAVTRGDIHMLFPGAVLGVMTALTPFVEADFDDHEPYFAVATGGMLAGLFIADRVWVRPYDHSIGDAAQISLGTLAGGLMGAAVAIQAEPGATVTMGLVTGGAILGTIAGHNLANPPRAGAQRTALAPLGGSIRGARLELNPAELALSAARVPGRHSMLTIRF